ncbi:MAG: GNAT family N-acetyltransferase [Saprospiraceae bacterium]|nr:GNAT family N-acetyltransferase [Saprospiraceae bacterium]MCB0577247.1 GNAT family N-acetyltransferase [Saprospiraceae bacterium]MCB9307594.1 GNAT family N-acetyltransferase [Lewinellaceae bacterium]MCB9354538.1 GNAT family N-acetyltransferase [Lewinellaceae bacterium]
MNVITARTDKDILKCWPVLKLLRPHLVEAGFVQQIGEMQSEGYELAFIEADGIAASAIGFRYIRKLYDGKQIYVDDLSTLEAHRGQGYAGILLEHVFALAKERGYDCVTLDSGIHRNDAHRLYLNKGFRISSLHFHRQ